MPGSFERPDAETSNRRQASVQHGMVVSKRGKNGGYALIRPPSEITFAQIVRIIDGPLAPLPCLSRMAYQRCDGCKDERTWTIRRVYAEVHEATTLVLEGTTLAGSLASGETADTRLRATRA